MRVAHVITRMIIGGAQENTLYNCLDLIEDFGDDVLLMTGPSDGPEGKLLELGRAGGLPIQFLDKLQRNIHPRDWSAYHQLSHAIAEFQPDVVHTHSAKGGFLGRAAARANEVPAIVHTVHGAPFHPYQNPLARRLFIELERWAAQRCHHMICVADAMRDLMVEARVASVEKFTTIYSGMDVEPFRNCGQFRADARKQLGFGNEDIVFGKIARLFNLKGHEYLIDAAARVVRNCPQAKFLLVGDGILRESLENQIKNSGLTKHFKLVGLVPPERIPFYLSAMDGLVHTSLREGLARTLPQALIAGKPVVSYDIDGAREVVIPGETGFLLPPQSVEPLAGAILALAQNPGMRQEFGRNGSERFTDRFRHKTMSSQIRKLYCKVLEASA